MHDYFKKIAVSLNIALLAGALILILDSPGGPANGKEMLILLLMVVSPAFTLFTFFAPDK